MKILVTGAGHIGSKLINYLKCYHEVVVFDNLLWGHWKYIYPAVRGCKCYIEDVTQWSENLIREIKSSDVIIPTAALVGAPLCDKFPEQTVELNQKWIEDLVNLVSNDQKIVYFNSNSSYGRSEGIVTEESPTNPLSLYAKTKEAGEKAVMSRDNSTTFRLATLASWSYRPRFDLLVPNLIIEAFTTGKIELYQGDFYRNYIHVNDVRRAVQLAILFSDRTNSVFNLGNDDSNCTKRELAQKICKVVGADLIEVNDREDPDKRDCRTSSAKFMNLVGWKPKYSLDDSIKEFYDYYCHFDGEDSSFRNY